MVLSLRSTRRRAPQSAEGAAEPAAPPALVSTDSAYLAGRREWNERYGSYIQQAAHWRMAAFGALAIAGLSVAWAGYRSSESRFVPFVVKVNKLGEAVAVRPLSEAQPRDSRVVVAQLARWIFDVRSVFHDGRAETALLKDAYGSVAHGSHAYASLNAWLRRNNPFERGQNLSVTVDVHDVLPISPHVYRVTWTERRVGKTTGTESVEQWSAIITVAISPPSSAAEIMKNPMGIYITDYSWSRSVV